MSQRVFSPVRFETLPEPERLLESWLAAQRGGDRNERRYWFVTACEPAQFRSLPAWFREQLDAFTPNARSAN